MGKIISTTFTGTHSLISDIFTVFLKIGDRCVVQDVLNKRWNILGTIKASEDGSYLQFSNF